MLPNYSIPHLENKGVSPYPIELAPNQVYTPETGHQSQN